MSRNMRNKMPALLEAYRKKETSAAHTKTDTHPQPPLIYKLTAAVPWPHPPILIINTRSPPPKEIIMYKVILAVEGRTHEKTNRYMALTYVSCLVADN